MKHIYIILSTCFLLSSCADILEEKPQSIAVETFYNTSGEVESGIAAIYTPLRSGDIFGAIYQSLQECSSDLILSGRASWAPCSQYEGLNSTAIGRAQNAWNKFYLAIRNANLLVVNVPNSSQLTNDEKNRYIAEAKFLRAFSYFHLVRNWGAIPLRTEGNMSEISIPRTSVDEIYNLIIADLQFSETYLPESQPVSGHPTTGSAKTALAEVYLTRGNYEKAASKSQEVISSGQFALVEVTVPDDFEKLYGSSVVTSSEDIFSFKYSQNGPWEFPIYAHGVGTQYLGIDGYFVFYSNSDYKVYKEWDDKDLRKQYMWYSYEGFDPGTMLLKKYNDPDNKTPKNDNPIYRYADCLLTYAEASCRANNAPTAEGLEALNKVHRRAYGYPSGEISPADYKLSNYNKDTFIELCIKERGYETVGEGKRWFDLKRTGKAEVYVKANRGIDIKTIHYLWPIPVSELNYNEAIKDQNPGY